LKEFALAKINPFLQATAKIGLILHDRLVKKISSCQKIGILATSFIIGFCIGLEHFLPGCISGSDQGNSVMDPTKFLASHQLFIAYHGCPDYLGPLFSFGEL
jgi:hypothetical protein